eukprot:scaffold290226_cov31-Tisochrysis_lutea.AAC.2
MCRTPWWLFRALSLAKTRSTPRANPIAARMNTNAKRAPLLPFRSVLDKDGTAGSKLTLESDHAPAMQAIGAQKSVPAAPTP